MRFTVQYRTEYRYAERVTEQHNALRVRPAVTPTQRVGRFRMTVQPNARLRAYSDYFGTEVVEFNVAAEHDRLVIEAEAEVETSPSPPAPDGPWSAAREESYAAIGGEFLLPTGDEPPAERLAGLVDELDRSSPLALLASVKTTVRERFAYRPGVTFVRSTVEDLLDGGAGVCQDFAHLALILLRREGIAARYVSGYLFVTNGDESSDSVEVNTHAWIEALLPGVDGGEPAWVGADPTNPVLADERYVKIGHGRHYGDVPPIRGVYRGSAPGAEHDVKVRMTRLEVST